MAKKKSESFPNDLLGTVELLVMKGVMACGDEAHGMAVFEAVRECYPRISFGSIYTSLERLTWKGYLEAKLGGPEPSRGGRARKYYKATGLGYKVAKATNDAVLSLKLVEA
jgi:PadR family transcriptional regulator, regulatory protein PadR